MLASSPSVLSQRALLSAEGYAVLYLVTAAVCPAPLLAEMASSLRRSAPVKAKARSLRAVSVHRPQAPAPATVRSAPTD